MIAAPPPIAHAVSVLAGRPTTVRCSPLRGASAHSFPHGWRFQQGPVVIFDATVCENLTLFRHGRVNGATGMAVLVLAHEAAHIAGATGETAAECVAARTAPRAVRLLGGLMTRGLREILVFAHGLIRGEPGYANRRC